jgi:molecular chaperone DnaJ
MLGKSYYLTLGVARNESAEGIRHAFREHVKRYHPDRVGPARLEFFDKILEAYHMLSHPERRRDYDRGLADAGDQPSAPAPVSLAPLDSSGLPQLAGTLPARCIKDALFESALARVSQNLIAAHIPQRSSPERLGVTVILSAAEALQGGMVDLAVPSCTPCKRCGGTGRSRFFACDLCDGEGLREEEEIVRMRVPPNVGDGALIEMPLRGLGLHNFYLCVHIRVAGAAETRPAAET